MATIPATTIIGGPNQSDLEHAVSWAAITQADTGGVVEIKPQLRHKTAVFSGTFGGGTFTLEASVDGTNFAPIASGLTAAGLLNFTSGARHWRIAVTGGAGASVNVQMTCVA